MPDPLKNVEKGKPVETILRESQKPRETEPKELGAERGEIAKTIGAGEVMEAGELMESGEVREVASETAERKGDMVARKKKDEGKAGAAAGGVAAQFIFDEKNLPPVPDMIAKIEKQLRREIRHLQKKAYQYQGGIFRDPDYPKYSETVAEIRKKHVLLRRLAHMAAEMLRSLFLHMFGRKRA